MSKNVQNTVRNLGVVAAALVALLIAMRAISAKLPVAKPEKKGEGYCSMCGK